MVFFGPFNKPYLAHFTAILVTLSDFPFLTFSPCCMAGWISRGLFQQYSFFQGGIQSHLRYINSTPQICFPKLFKDKISYNRVQKIY